MSLALLCQLTAIRTARIALMLAHVRRGNPAARHRLKTWTWTEFERRAVL